MGGTNSKDSDEIYELKVGSTIHFEIHWFHRILPSHRICWEKDGQLVGAGLYSKDNANVTDSGSYVGYIDGNPKYKYTVLVYENLFENEFLGIRTAVTNDETCVEEKGFHEQTQDESSEEDQGKSKGWFSESKQKNKPKNQSSEGNDKEKGLQEYNMTKNPRGIVVIIAIDEFEIEKMNIKGMKQKDTEKCRETFQSLHFEIKECTATKADGIIKYLKEIANYDYRNYDCFALYISTHGGHGYVYCSDFKPSNEIGTQKGCIALSELLEIFLPDNCKSLKDKPKLFFFDSCRNLKCSTGKHQSPIRVFGSEKEKAIYYADILIGYATMVGNSTHALENFGSYYTDVLTECLREHAPNESLVDVMVEVTNRMKEQHTQISHYESTLTGKIVMKKLNSF